LSCFGNINKRGSVHSATRCRKDTRDRAAPRRPEPAPRRSGLDEPQRPGGWADNLHRGHDASRGRIRPRLPPRRSWQRCPGPKLLRKGTSCFLPFSAARRHDSEASHEQLNGT
jgi:hypothetical protein